ncbi:MAG TPA: dienelactone hydrolase family protein [Longimicrobiaceae bacterium]|nr:dienelactone hydrolase family protein [Longimicrobiaceae bacterium]
MPKPSHSDPHADAPVLSAGSALAEARAAVILVHGRGASARSILSLAREMPAPDVAYLAPEAAGNVWYPHSFLAPIEQNEPGLSSALARLGQLLASTEDAGIPPERTMLLGFSQGACLVLEFAARHARRYGGVAGLSGGLIGPEGTPRDYHGSLAGTPVFLGCSDTDPHIPLARVDETARVLEAMGAAVDARIYPGMGHTVNADELRTVRTLLGGVRGARS